MVRTGNLVLLTSLLLASVYHITSGLKCLYDWDGPLEIKKGCNVCKRTWSSDKNGYVYPFGCSRVGCGSQPQCTNEPHTGTCCCKKDLCNCDKTKWDFCGIKGNGGNGEQTTTEGGNGGNEEQTTTEGGNGGNEEQTTIDGGNGGNGKQTTMDGGNGGNGEQTTIDGGNTENKTTDGGNGGNGTTTDGGNGVFPKMGLLPSLGGIIWTIIALF